MWAWAGFIFITLQLALCSWAFVAQQHTLFNLFFTELSPVVLFFSLLNEVGLAIGVKVTNYLVFSLAWNVLKYVCFLCAYHTDAENKMTYVALFLEAVYVGLATYALFYYVEL